MHSIVVLGDVRTHYVNIEASDEWERDVSNRCRRRGEPVTLQILGGAFFMKDAIERAILPVNQHDAFRIFSYESPKLPDSVEAGIEFDGGEAWNWELTPFAVTEHGKSRPRLKSRKRNLTGRNYPQLEKSLTDVLGDPCGQFEQPIMPNGAELRLQIPECPDIVAFDDLNVMLRHTTIPGEEANISENEAIKLRAKLVPGKAVSNAEKFAAALALLFERFARAKSKAMERRFPIMEPVIIGSIKNDPASALANRKNRTVWRELFKDEFLRTRTIVLMDAQDLRQSGLAVSTGLSWERTAQDTIAELRRSTKAFRPFLEFGQVIIRYGVTGALHIVRRSERDWSYTLFFDPAHEDTTWTVDERDGVVLGYHSVFVASLVQSLKRHCDNHLEHPFVGDLPSTIAEALRDAIGRCQHVSRYSYGETCWDEFENRLRKDELLPPKLYSADRTSRIREEPVLIADTSVPPVLLRNWSILNQSAQSRVGAIAQDIVRFGAPAILNQPALDSRSILKIRERLVEEIVNEAVVPRDEFAARDWELTSDVQRTIWDKVLGSYEIFGTRSRSQLEEIVRQPSLREWKELNEVIREAERTQSASLPAEQFRTKLAAKLNDELARFASVIQLPGSPDVHDDAIVAPLVPFGKYDKGQLDDAILVVDRREIEGYRAIQRLMRDHIESVKKKEHLRPLAIAVFGPPGSGKSTSVKKINESLDDTRTIVLDPYNLAQFSDLNDLENAFDEIMKQSVDDRIPIAFFDEFDSRFPSGDEPLGWLRFFLAPMEDGAFRGKTVKNAILVFAGGTSNTFSEFSLADRSNTDPLWIAFSKAKGPDFVSRLKGHLNIVGINPADPDDELYLIRRAILIRTTLSKMQKLRKGDHARIDPDMLRAILHVPEYWHGGRSVRMLLDLCRANDGRISASAVPPIHQLNMLVDGKAFLDLMTNVSAGK